MSFDAFCSYPGGVGARGSSIVIRYYMAYGYKTDFFIPIYYLYRQYNELIIH
nr:MAG TPA: hypothetical protein [Caudoviricetes sp.]